MKKEITHPWWCSKKAYSHNSKDRAKKARRTIRECLEQELPKIPFELRRVVPLVLMLMMSCASSEPLTHADFVGETVCNLDTRSNSTLPGYAVSCITFRRSGTGEIEYYTGKVLVFTYEFTEDDLCLTYPSALTDCAPYRVSDYGYLEWKGDYFFVR